MAQHLWRAKGPRSEILRGGTRSDPPFKEAYTFMLEPRLQLTTNCKNDDPKAQACRHALCRPCPPRLRKLHEGLPECQRPSVRCTCRCFHAFSGCWQAKVTFSGNFGSVRSGPRAFVSLPTLRARAAFLSPKHKTLNSATRNETLNLVFGRF